MLKPTFLARCTISSCLVLASAGPAAAVIIRHDRPQEAYAAKAAELPSYCRMQAPDGGGALIARNWVITAAHLASDLKPGHKIRCGEEALTIDRVVVHPQYDDGVGRHDLMLLHLEKPAQTRPILALWRQADEKGRVVNLIGHWEGGTGLTGGVRTAPKLLLAATNRIEVADKYWLRLVMDQPSTPGVTELEGVSGGGDSGAPAYIIEGGCSWLVGVGSRSLNTERDSKESGYGDTDLYVRVSRYADWIEATIKRGS